MFSGRPFHGPGFVEEPDLVSGLRALQIATPFDVALLGPATPFLGETGFDAIATPSLFLAATSHHHEDQSLLAFFAGARDAFGKLPASVRVVSALNFDYYGASQNQIDQLLEQPVAVLGPNHQFVLALADLPDFVSSEKHYIKKPIDFPMPGGTSCSSIRSVSSLLPISSGPRNIA